METLIVNTFGGPGVGKITACWHIASELKKKGIYQLTLDVVVKI